MSIPEGPRAQLLIRGSVVRRITSWFNAHPRATLRALLSGPLGGDQQIGALIAEGKVDMLIFFWDPLSPQPHDPDVKALLRLCTAWNVPMACNRATADFLISSPLFASGYRAPAPDFSAYITRDVNA